MKKLIIAITLALCAFVARAEDTGITTSQAYVETKVAEKQDTVPANNANSVMTYDSTSDDGIGAKAIYNESLSYETQTNALLTAGTANAAIQNAIDNEFTCANPPKCTLWHMTGLFPPTLPAGYTELEYLESDGHEYLDLGQPIGSGENITVKFAFLNDTRVGWFGASEDADWRGQKFVFSHLYENPLMFMIYSTANTDLNPKYYECASPCVIGTPYVLNWYGNPFAAPTLSPQITFNNQGLTASNYLYTPTRNAYLFATNAPNFNPNATLRKMRIYYFKVDGKMNLIPAKRDSDNVLGMYDLVTNTFFTNQGSGTFIAGPTVSFIPQNVQ